MILVCELLLTPPSVCSIRTLAWNPAGVLIATGSADRTLRIWNPDRPDVRYSTELRGHTSGIEQVAFNPVKESELASCSADGTVRFWDVRSKNCVGRVDVGGEAFTLNWTANGSALLAGRKVRSSLLLAFTHRQADWKISFSGRHIGPDFRTFRESFDRDEQNHGIEPHYDDIQSSPFTQTNRSNQWHHILTLHEQ